MTPSTSVFHTGSTLPYSIFGVRFAFVKDYIGISRSSMADKYRMTPNGSEFILNHNAGVTVGVYKTEMEGRRGMKECRRDYFFAKNPSSFLQNPLHPFCHNLPFVPR